MRRAAIALCLLAPLAGGCAAKTAFDLATMPVKTTRDAVNAGSKTVDLLTTSQGERTAAMAAASARRKNGWRSLIAATASNRKTAPTATTKPVAIPVTHGKRWKNFARRCPGSGIRPPLFAAGR